MSKYNWQGEPVQVEFGHFHAKPDETRPLAWYNFECETDPARYSTDGSCAIDAIRFTYRDQVIIIANHFGIGEHKLRHGGWPSHRHFSFGAGKFVPLGFKFEYGRLNELEFSEHEAKREAWMRRTDPKEFERIQLLRQASRRIATSTYQRYSQ